LPNVQFLYKIVVFERYYVVPLYDIYYIYNGRFVRFAAGRVTLTAREYWRLVKSIVDFLIRPGSEIFAYVPIVIHSRYEIRSYARRLEKRSIGVSNINNVSRTAAVNHRRLHSASRRQLRNVVSVDGLSVLRRKSGGQLYEYKRYTLPKCRRRNEIKYNVSGIAK